MTVITPTLTPRMVSDERSLFARNVSIAIRADSRISTSRIAKKRGRRQGQSAGRKPARSCRLLPALRSPAPAYSDLSASIGSSRAARQAGQSPLMIPTTDETPTPSAAEAKLINSGKPINAAIR